MLNEETITQIADELVEAGWTRTPVPRLTARYPGMTVEETGVAAGVLNHPAAGVYRLAKKIAAHGDGLKAGEIILAASFIRPMWVYAGDTVVADYGKLGTVTCRFE